MANMWWEKGLLFCLGAIVMLFLDVAIAESSTSGEFYSVLARWMEIGAVVLFFVGIIMFLGGAADIVKGNYGAGSSGRSGRDWCGGRGGERGKHRRR